MKEQKITLCLSAFFLMSTANFAISGPVPSGCTIANVELTKLTVQNENDYIYLRGIMKHSCKGAIGIELKWDSKFKDGSVAFVSKFWPNSIQNIPANTEFPFEMMNPSKIPTETNSVSVTRITSW